MVLVALFVASCTPKAARGGTSAARQLRPMQDFRLESLDHGRFYLNQQRGSVVVLIFWATWCTSCKLAMEELAPIFRSFPDDRIVAAAVCTDPQNATEVRAVAETVGAGYPILLDRGSELFLELGLRALPTIVVIDAEGNIAYQKVGYSMAIKKQIELTLSSLLG